MNVVGLFAGIGGLEVGLAKSGLHASLLVEKEPAAAYVLAQHFSDVDILSDVRDIDEIPHGTDVVVAGFPCQDLSSSGLKTGIEGSRSSLVGEVFRLLETRDVAWVVLENVPFLLSLNNGRALTTVTTALTELGYAWAYRVIDSRGFGLPQRRNRWYLVASKAGDPRDVLLSDNSQAPAVPVEYSELACGFYWTEGMRSFGWAVDAIPPIKVGSSIGVASPPAVRMPNGRFVTPDIRDAERLQGFQVDWTAPALDVARPGERWRMVGNSVSVPVADWLGEKLMNPRTYDWSNDRTRGSEKWSRKAAWADKDGVVHLSEVGPWPVWRDRPSLASFLQYEGKPLSVRAATGFLSRTQKGSLRFPAGFIAELESYTRGAAA